MTLSAYDIRSARTPGGPAWNWEGLSRVSSTPGESRESSAGVGSSSDSLSEHKRRPIRPLWLALRGGGGSSRVCHRNSMKSQSALTF